MQCDGACASDQDMFKVWSCALASGIHLAMASFDGKHHQAPCSDPIFFAWRPDKPEGESLLGRSDEDQNLVCCTFRRVPSGRNEDKKVANTDPCRC